MTNAYRIMTKRKTSYAIRHYAAGVELSGKPYAEAFDVIMTLPNGQRWSCKEFPTRAKAEEYIAKALA
jgi:hypothetical protein